MDTPRTRPRATPRTTPRTTPRATLAPPLRLRAAALAAGFVLLLGQPPSQAQEVVTQTRSVAGFDTIVLAVPSELSIEQGGRESMQIECEPAILSKITSEVQGRRLLIGTRPGQMQTRQPIRIKLGVRTLRTLEARAPSSITTGPLKSDSLALVLTGGGSAHVARLDSADSLDVRMSGAGDVSFGGGHVKDQQLSISGSGSYTAPALASESAQVAIAGSGEVQLAASSRLAVRIDGVGHVRYRGDPEVTRSIRGIGTIEKD